MIILDSTLKKLQLTTSAAVNTDYYVAWADITTSAFTPGESDGQITTATTTDILAAPASSTQRQVKYISIVNRSTTTAQNITLLYNNNGTTRNLTTTLSLQPGEQLQYTQESGWQPFTSQGALKVSSKLTGGYSGQASHMFKVGAAAEAANIMHCLGLSSGFPGAWAPGSPGVAGRTCTGTDTTNDGGCYIIKNATTGRNFLTSINLLTTTNHSYYLKDFLWVNSGITVTTTTSQTINSVTLPARDSNGGTSGVGVIAGILVTTATTNGGAITNTTLTYTNSAGTGSRTATMASFPATAVAGTFVPFQLAAGDIGIQSIQSITLGTSYGGGAISVVMFRTIAEFATGADSTSKVIVYPDPGVLLYNGVCLLPIYMAATTTATSMFSNIVVQERP